MDRFIPGIWMGKVLMKLYDIIGILNPNLETSYEGEIRQLGDMVLFRKTYNIAPWGTFHRTDRMHQVMIDKDFYVTALVDDVILVQLEAHLLDHYCQQIAEKFIEGMEVPRCKAFFAAQILYAEKISVSPSFQDKVRVYAGYGYKLLEGIRWATEIIGKGHRAGLSVDEIIGRLEQEGF